MRFVPYVIIGFLLVQDAFAESSIIESSVSNTYIYTDHYEVLINRPAEEVWPHLLDLGSWMYDFEMALEDGEPQAEGALYRLYSGEDFFYLIVKIIPGRMIVGVNLPSNMEGEESVGIAMFTLAEVGGKTLVTNFMSRQYDWPVEEPSPIKQRRESEDFKAFNSDMWGRFLGRLKEVTERE